ncbi:hypothetical protein PENANT_c006G06510 [Penicillium antarcticum]|uniref:Uncharacterized protein n=1 Tax=Penicillium antarcticum TaxID=416450 RepID=A0A1V6QDB4_9EURO|nr:uncharacterized protein N7508_009295 [Penicillium antarcticum]KAJ5294474.1 hypothetical protein N7508_009295 [Penicillium antarcticum]OQD87210.1 hypothetical protein PENANT_c006G06510 [Penicillium antarcticum]
MPVEVMGLEDSHALERPLLRSHKALPRRGITIPSIEVIQPVSPDHNGTLNATPAPPLTPPGHDVDRTPRKMDSSLSDLTTGMLTPRRASKPPTPEVTPPRTNANKRPLLSQFVHVSSSSRAESFQTANENISSSDDMDTPGRSSQTTTQTPRQRKPSKPPTATGSHSYFTSARESPLVSQQPSDTEYETGFETFDGDWTMNTMDDSPTPAGKRKSARKYPQLNDQPCLDNNRLDVKHLDASLMREKKLRDRVHGAHELTNSSSMERFREEIGWPSPEDPTKHGDPVARPLSDISSTSTVSAMIIDSPKRAQRMLRHTEKRSSLRSASSPITHSERTSYVSLPESQHRLVHKPARISEQGYRSASSGRSFSAKTSNSAINPNIETIKVVVIPERSSSLNSGRNSFSSSKPGSQRSSRRPPTTSTGHVDVPRQKKRTMSDSVFTHSRATDSRSRSIGRPVIPPRSSSLSAPTSRNNSRATSLTSASLQSHNMAMDLEMQKRRDQQPVSPPRHNVLSYDPSDFLEVPNMHAFATADDMTLHPPSLPFTGGSIPSSSPGPIEIQEATAVSFFAHHNRSLLLVDPRMQSSRRPLQGVGISNGPVYLHTPDNPIQPGMITVDSPLKNPRPPPKPPVAKPLPPIPIQEGEKSSDENKGLNRRWSSVRRTWNARPRSESFNTIARSFSMKSAKNRTTGMEMDSRLYPFWRPRPFWEGVSDSPNKNGSPTRQLPQNRNDSLVVNNTLGLPQQRIIFDGPPAYARRSPEMKRLFNGMTSNGSLVDPSIFRTASPLHPSRFRALSRWGLRVQSMSWRNTRNSLRRLRQRREERKRAVRRETLKQSIGGPVYVASSATTGVAGRQ